MFSVALLQEGMSYKQLSQDNEKAQLLQSRQWGVEEVCRLYKIPPHMVQMLAKATNNNIEHQGLQFVMYTLLAWLKRHEGRCSAICFSPANAAICTSSSTFPGC